MTALVENDPLGRIDRKPRSIGGKIVQLEFSDAPLEPLANLALYLTEARPLQAELRQRPLQKGYAVHIVGQASASAVMTVPGLRKMSAAPA